MKTTVSFLLLVATMVAPHLHAQFPNFPAADLVLGASNLTTEGSASATASGMNGPTCVAVDPVSGKVFVVASGQRRILRFANAAALANGANAEAVFGQINFSGTSSGLTQSKFGTNVTCCHLDQQGRMWVADRGNNRILMFHGAATLSNGAPADLVIGQADFVTGSSGTTATKLNNPFNVFVDADDNLWVADSGNNRVLKFPNASSLANGAAATVALGQPNLTTVTEGTSDVKMDFPNGVVVDATGTLWVVENDNARVVRFDNADSLGSGAAASGVLGQSDFVSNATGVSATSLNNPSGVAFDGSGSLFVLDNVNIRILLFRNPKTKANGAAADGVIGQLDFTSNSSGLSDRRFDTGPGNGIAFDSSGALWAPDQNNARVLRFSPDRTKPVLKVTSRVPKTVTKGSLALKGTASDTSGISRVRSRTGSAAFATATGTTSWSAKAKLKKGRNRIEIIATDTVGNDSVTKRITVTRD